MNQPLTKLSEQTLDAEVRDQRPPLRKAFETVKEVAIPVVGAAAAGIASMASKPAVPPVTVK